MGFFDTLLKKTVPEAPKSEKTLLNEYKQQALDSAKAAADARGEKPTLTDYHIAAEKLWQENGALMRSQGIQDFSPRVYADMSGLRINGYDINNEHIEVPGSQLDPKSMRYNAVQGARAMAHQQGRSPTRLDVLQTLKTLQAGGDAAASVLQGIESQKDFLDLDENHEIGPLYGTFEQIASQTKFENTVLGDCLIHPAGTTFAHHAEGAVHNGCTFSGQQEHEVKFTGALGGNNIIRDVNGGSFSFEGVRSADPSKGPAKIVMEKGTNKFANITISNSQMEIDTGGASMVRLDVKKSTLINSNFAGSTIKMLSVTDQVEFVNPNFEKTNLVGVTFKNTTFKGADFSKAKIEDLKFEGNSKLVNCSFSPEQIPQLRQAGIEQVKMENVRVGNVVINNSQASLDMAGSQLQVGDVIAKMRDANASLKQKTPSEEAPAPQAPIIDRPIIAAPKSPEPKREPVGALDELAKLKAPEAANLTANPENLFAAALREGRNIIASGDKPAELSATATFTSKPKSQERAPANYYLPNQGRTGAA